MPSKERERVYLHRLQQLCPVLAAGLVEETERPDFLVRTETRVVGIEFTTFHLRAGPATRPEQETGALQQRVVQIAEGLHSREGGPALYVRVAFSDRPPLRKTGVRQLARDLACAIRRQPVPRSLNDPHLVLRLGDVPAGIDRVLIYGSIKGTDKLWQVGGAWWVSPIFPKRVQEIIDRKAVRTHGFARARCDELWLVIVHDLLARGAPAELSAEAVTAGYGGPFDKIYWLDPHEPRIWRLRRKPTRRA